MTRKRKPASSPPAPTQPVDAMSTARNIREAVESVAIAFILAFLFKTFQAEAFVIPTGSMAPTLQGEHKDVLCPKCQFRCRVGASDAVHVPMQTICPICYYRMSLDPRDDGLQSPMPGEGPSRQKFAGDRILVTKFAYELDDPQRWDVIVFKFIGGGGQPGKPAGLPNYIKRLVGLPGEQITIVHGDVYRKELDSTDNQDYRILRKPPHKVKRLAQWVDDNHRIPRSLRESGFPLRWQVWPPDVAQHDGSWQMEIIDDEPNVAQRFHTSGAAEHDVWIRYQHFVPSPDIWKAIDREESKDLSRVAPQLITDFCGYNAGTPQPGRLAIANVLGWNWVGDLLLECDLSVERDGGTLLLDLVEAGKHFRCSIDVATGVAELAIEGVESFSSRGQTSLQGPGDYEVAFANIDNELLLWIDDQLVEFDRSTQFNALEIYEDPDAMQPRFHSADDPGDLSPLGVGSRGAELTIHGLRVKRDVYYVAGDIRVGMAEFLLPPGIDRNSIHSRRRFLSDPNLWSVYGDRDGVEYQLGEDEYFVLGDNSPSSLDSRLWDDPPFSDGNRPRHVVRGKELIGKALCIYWPHSWYFPFPNFGDMGLVH